jgi:type I restriction enzyme, S subunit
MSSAQLPEGYKQTGVGVIPEDWELKTIGDLASVGSGGTPSRTNLSYWDGPIPWITTTQIDCNFIHDAEQFITQDGLDNSAAKLFPPGTLLMAMYGQGKTRGKVAILGVQASTNQACAAILLGKNLEHSYAFHYLSSQYEAIRNLSNTGNQENLNGFIIKSIKIPLPPLPEQRSIAQSLSDVDALIASLDKLIAKQRHLKTAAMQQLLTGKMRLPGFSGSWRKGILGNECSLITKGTTPTSLGHTFKEQGINFIKIESVTEDGNILFEKLAYIDAATHALLNRSQLQEKDILFSIAGALGRCALVKNDLLPANTNQALAIIRLKTGAPIEHKFLLTYLRSTVIQEYIDTINVQAAQANLSLENINNFEIIIPSLEEQRAIATVLSDMDAAIAALETRRAKTQAIKQGMMQELLTGRTRLV